MKRTLALLMLVYATDVSLAQSLSVRLLERNTASAIRDAGFWCGKITNARVDRARSAIGPTIVQITCDDKTAFAQYKLTMTAENKISKIEVWK